MPYVVTYIQLLQLFYEYKHIHIPIYIDIWNGTDYIHTICKYWYKHGHTYVHTYVCIPNSYICVYVCMYVMYGMLPLLCTWFFAILYLSSYSSNLKDNFYIPIF